MNSSEPINPYEPPRMAEAVETTTATTVGSGLQRDGQHLRVCFVLTVDDAVQFFLHLNGLAKLSLRGRIVVWMIFPLLCWFICTKVTNSVVPPPWRGLYVAGTLLPVIFGASWLMLYRLSRVTRESVASSMTEDDRKNFFGNWKIVVSPDQIFSQSPGSTHSYLWTAIHKLDRSPAAIYVFTAANAALTIPSHAFDSSQEMDEMEQTIRGYLKRNLSSKDDNIEHPT